MFNPNENRRWFNGSFGNLSVSPSFVGTVSAASGATVDVCKVEPNIKVVGLMLHGDALGASTTVTFKIGGTAITKAISTAAETNLQLIVDDYVSNDGDVLQFVVGGGAAAGKVRVKLQYEMVGNL